MENSGARLKKIRLEKGISLEEVQQKTKIHLDILKSIEDDSLVDLKPVYIKGFLKIYCQYLGIDPAECLAGYSEPAAVASPKSSEKSREPYRRPPVVKKISFKPRTALLIAAAVLAILLIAGIMNLVRSCSRQLSSSRKAKVQLSIPKPKPAKRSGAKKISPKTGPAATQSGQKKSETSPSSQISPYPAGAVTQESGVRIGLHALEDCWVQAKVDGKMIFQNILKKGRFESWTAKDKVELSLGSAGGVRLEINGNIIPPLGRKGQVLKNILITKKDGLKVDK